MSEGPDEAAMIDARARAERPKKPKKSKKAKKERRGKRDPMRDPPPPPPADAPPELGEGRVKQKAGTFAPQPEPEPEHMAPEPELGPTLKRSQTLSRATSAELRGELDKRTSNLGEVRSPRV